MGLIVGVEHDPRYANTLLWYLDTKHHPRKVLIELPPTPDTASREFRTTYPFFSAVDGHYRRQGAQVIHGDTRRFENERIHRGLRAMQRLEELTDDEIDTMRARDLPEIGALVVDAWKGWWYATTRNVISPARNRGFADSVSTHRPDTIIVGDAHARYLARVFPHYTYLRCVTKKPNVLRNIVDTAFGYPRPQEVLVWRALEDQRVDALLTGSNKLVGEWVRTVMDAPAKDAPSE